MRVKILPNTTKKWARKLAKSVVLFLRKRGFDVVRKNADATITIGGDGTLLYYWFRGELEGAVLGIGSESSYLCQLKKNNWKENIERILRRKKTEKRTLLDVSINKKTYKAINDVVLHTTNYRAINIDVFIDRKKHSFFGDGVIVSTPTGSSGYAYSAGANILKPTARKFVIAPICPYMRRFSPTTIDDKSTVIIKSNDKAALVIDGVFIKNIKNKAVKIKKGGTWGYLLKKS
jgi:NAD+ kinase